MSDPRAGARLGIDVGSVRIGVAVCDPSAVIATPLDVVARDARTHRDLAAIAEHAVQRAVIEVVVGWPKSLSGKETRAAGLARGFAEQLAATIAPTPVRLVDERLSTVEAARRLRGAGRDAKAARAVIDAAAAVVILESALEVERRTGRPPGELVEVAMPAS